MDPRPTRKRWPRRLCYKRSWWQSGPECVTYHWCVKKQKTKTLILDYNNISSLMLNHQLWVIELILWYFLYIQEIERVWCQYERMESELSVVRSQLQHICNFGMPQVILHYKPNSFCLIRPMPPKETLLKCAQHLLKSLPQIWWSSCGEWGSKCETLLYFDVLCGSCPCSIQSGAISGSERAVDDGGHTRWTKIQSESLPLPAGDTETSLWASARHPTVIFRLLLHNFAFIHL